MVAESTVAAYVVSAAAIVTATAAVAAAKWVRELADQVESNSRILRGEEDVEAWGGLVAMVHEHRETLREHGLLSGFYRGGTDDDGEEVSA